MSGGAGAGEALADRMRERNEARKTAAEERRREREGKQRKDESVAYFTREFSAKKSAIAEMLSSANAVPKPNLPSHFDLISQSYQSLQKYTSDSSMFLTAYDLSSAQRQLAELLQSIDELRGRLVPKKKFAFKSRKKETEDPKSAQEKQQRQEGEEGGGERRSSNTAIGATQGLNSVVIRDRENENIMLTAAEVKGQDVSLVSLRGCEVRLLGPASTVHTSKIDSCKILCGPVSSSVFIDKCKDTTFAVACQQLRVHSTRSTIFYLHVSSRAIIEDCSGLSFAPYALSYPEMEAHFSLTGLERGGGNWDTVDDFNWLASKEPSPNWRVLPEEERTSFTLT